MATAMRALMTTGVLIGLVPLGHAESVVQAAAREKDRRAARAATARVYADDDLARLAEARRATERLRVQGTARRLSAIALPGDDTEAIVVGTIDRTMPEIRDLPGIVPVQVHKGTGHVASVSCVDRPSVEDSCLMSYLVVTDASGQARWTDTPCERKPSPWPTYNEEDRDGRRCGISPPPRGGEAPSGPSSQPARPPEGGVRSWARTPTEAPAAPGPPPDGASVRTWSREVTPWGTRPDLPRGGESAVFGGNSGSGSSFGGRGMGSSASREERDPQPASTDTERPGGVTTWSGRLR